MTPEQRSKVRFRRFVLSGRLSREMDLSKREDIFRQIKLMDIKLGDYPKSDMVTD